MPFAMSPDITEVTLHELWGQAVDDQLPKHVRPPPPQPFYLQGIQELRVFPTNRSLSDPDSQMVIVTSDSFGYMISRDQESMFGRNIHHRTSRNKPTDTSPLIVNVLETSNDLELVLLSFSPTRNSHAELCSRLRVMDVEKLFSAARAFSIYGTFSHQVDILIVERLQFKPTEDSDRLDLEDAAVLKMLLQWANHFDLQRVATYLTERLETTSISVLEQSECRGNDDTPATKRRRMCA